MIISNCGPRCESIGLKQSQRHIKASLQSVDHVVRSSSGFLLIFSMKFLVASLKLLRRAYGPQIAGE